MSVLGVISQSAQAVFGQKRTFAELGDIRHHAAHQARLAVGADVPIHTGCPFGLVLRGAEGRGLPAFGSPTSTKEGKQAHSCPEQVVSLEPSQPTPFSTRIFRLREVDVVVELSLSTSYNEI